MEKPRTHKQITPSPNESAAIPISEELTEWSGKKRNLNKSFLPDFYDQQGISQNRNFFDVQCGLDSLGNPSYATDIDNNEYGMLSKGPIHCWLDTNLRTTTYSSGDEIPSAISQGPGDDSYPTTIWSEWITADEGLYSVVPGCTGVWCMPEVGSILNVDTCGQGFGEYCNECCTEIFGNLYNWHAVDDSRGICPEGWRVSTDFDWIVLEHHWEVPEEEPSMIWGENPDLCAMWYIVEPPPSENNCYVEGPEGYTDGCDQIYNCQYCEDTYSDLSDCGNGCCTSAEDTCNPLGAYCCDDAWPYGGYETYGYTCEYLESINWDCAGCLCPGDNNYTSNDCILHRYGDNCGDCPTCTDEVINGWTHNLGFRGDSGLGAMFAAEADLWNNPYGGGTPDLVTHEWFGASGYDFLPSGKKYLYLNSPVHLYHCCLDDENPYCTEDASASVYDDECSSNIMPYGRCGPDDEYICSMTEPFSWVGVHWEGDYWTGTTAGEAGYAGVNKAMVRQIPPGQYAYCNEFAYGGDEHPDCTCIKRTIRKYTDGYSVRCVTDMFSIYAQQFGVHCPGWPAHDSMCYEAVVVNGYTSVSCGQDYQETCTYLYELSIIEDEIFTFELKTRYWDLNHWTEYLDVNQIEWTVQVNTNSDKVSAITTGNNLQIWNSDPGWNGTANITLTMNGENYGMWVEDTTDIDVHVLPAADAPTCTSFLFDTVHIDEDTTDLLEIDVVEGGNCTAGTEYDSIDFLKIIDVTDLDGDLLDGNRVLENGDVVIGGGMWIPYMADWNLVSLPMNVEDASALTVFPTSVEGTLFSFDGTYVNEEELNPGTGYWIRFQDAGTQFIEGEEITSLTISLQAEWNMIGGISDVVEVAQISDPGGIVIPGTVYEFSGEPLYHQTNNIAPGKGYWIRANAAGSITLSFTSMARSFAPVTFDVAADYHGTTTFKAQVCSGDPSAEGDWACSDDINVFIPVDPVPDAPNIWRINADSDFGEIPYNNDAEFTIFEMSENTEGGVRFRANIDAPFNNSDLRWYVEDTSGRLAANFQEWDFVHGTSDNQGGDVTLELIPKKNYNTFNFDNPSAPTDNPISVKVYARLELDGVNYAQSDINFNISVPYVSSKPEAPFIEIYAAVDEGATLLEPILFHKPEIDTLTYYEWYAIITSGDQTIIEPSSVGGCGDTTLPYGDDTPAQIHNLCIYDPDPVENNPWFEAYGPAALLSPAIDTYLAIQILEIDENSQWNHTEYCYGTGLGLMYKDINGDLQEVALINDILPSFPDEGHVPYFELTPSVDGCSVAQCFSELSCPNYGSYSDCAGAGCTWAAPNMGLYCPDPDYVSQCIVFGDPCGSNLQYDCEYNDMFGPYCTGLDCSGCTGGGLGLYYQCGDSWQGNDADQFEYHFKYRVVECMRWTGEGGPGPGWGQPYCAKSQGDGNTGWNCDEGGDLDCSDEQWVTILVYDYGSGYTSYEWEPGRGPIQFTDTSVPGIGGFIYEWAWDFDDGVTNCCDEPDPSHDYENPGTYTVQLQTMDSIGNMHFRAQQVIVE